MIDLFWWLAQNTITAAVMVLLVVGACRPFRNRPAVQHLLWVVVLLKFVTPPVVTWPWSLQDAGRALRSLAAIGGEPRPGTGPDLDASIAPDDRGQFGAQDDQPQPSPSESSDVVLNYVPRPVAFSADRGDVVQFSVELLLGVWVAGAVVCGYRQLCRIARHASLVRRGMTPPVGLTREVAALASQIGLRPPKAVIAHGILSPFVWFLGRPCLVWPEAMSSHGDVLRSRGVIAHELAHIRRRDHWVAWLELFAGLFWWWNPLFWFVARRIRTSAEMACDAVAIAVRPEFRREYAELLLELSAGLKTGEPVPALGVGAATRSSFERRLSMVLSDRVSSKVSALGLVTATLLALVAVPGWSRAQQDRPRDVPSGDAPDHGLPTGRNAFDVGDDATPKPKTASPSPVGGSPATATTAERLQRLETALDRLQGLIDRRGDFQRNQLGVPERSGQGFRRSAAPAPKVATGRRYFDRWSEAMTPVVLFGSGRTYILANGEKEAYLTALSGDGRQIWLSHFKSPMPIRGDGSHWSVEEATMENRVRLTWTQADQRMQFVFELNTGKPLVDDHVPPTPVTTNYFRGRQLGAASENERLERLEKAVEELQKRLLDRPSAGPADAPRPKH